MKMNRVLATALIAGLVSGAAVSAKAEDAAKKEGNSCKGEHGCKGKKAHKKGKKDAAADAKKDGEKHEGEKHE